MILEAIVAINAGLIAHSLALVSFWADSIIELIAGSVMLWRLIIEIKGEGIEKVDNAEKMASWVLVVGVIMTALFGWWWIDTVISLAFVYFVIKEGIEAIQEGRGKEDTCNCCGDD